MAPPAVETEDLAYAYDGVSALDGISMSLPEGSVAALLGPNGAGKTTFIRLITGALTAQQGTVRVLGDSPGAVDRERIGALPQSFEPPERLTPRELLDYYAGLYDRSRATADILADLGLTSVADRPYRKLSGGEQRRTCLGTTLVNDPELLVLDEPTARIDPAGKRDIWAYIPRLVDAGTTVILATHDMVEAERLAEQVGFFYDGELIAFGTTDELVADRIGQRRLVIDTSAPGELAETLDAGAPAEGALVIDAVDEAELPELIRRAVDAKASIGSIRWEHPPLEELFLTLVDDQVVAP